MAYHHGDLDRALLDAALARLDAGEEIPSLRALADACGVSHAAPYRHFANAEALRGAVATTCFEALTVALETSYAAIPDPAERLRTGCRTYLRWGRAHPTRYALMFGDRSPAAAHPGCQAAATAAFGTLVDSVARCGASDPPRTATAAWAALHGVVELARQGLSPTGTPPGNALDADVVEMIVGQVTRPRAAPAA